MSSPIIIARGVSKQYRIGARAPYASLRESLTGLVRAPFQWFRGKRQPPPTFWALDDVNFEVARGESLGIVGRNGAGKSTLLKILSNITAPTQGEIRLRGRVASLLEVGTGFHPELTGRENVFLNGTIMGMSRAEIRKSFDEIVAFAEIEQFLDTPVKHYSSGMYVRLAFAVAAHLLPEILIIDEVLAVGDAAFQKRCLGKMESVASSGRTVLFVTHNMAAVTRFCSRALLLQKGRLVADGRADAVVAQYLRGGAGDTPVAVDYEATGRIPGNQHARLLAARLRLEGPNSAVADIRKPVHVDIEYELLTQMHAVHPGVVVHGDDGTIVFCANDSSDPESRKPRVPGRYRTTLTIPGNLLAEAMYTIDLSLATHEPHIAHVWAPGSLVFQVHDPAESDSARGTFGGPFPGPLRPLLPWHTEPLD